MLNTYRYTVMLFAVMTACLNAQWTEQDSGVIDSLLEVSFADPMNGCIIGTNETILTTNDGGKNWIKRDSPVNDVKFNKVQLIDQNNGFIIGDNGLILKTVDGGKNWTNISSLFMKYNFSDLSFVDPMNGWLSCWWQSKSTPIERIGVILHTTDGGNNWETQIEIKTGLQFSTVFMAIEFLNNSLGWALGGKYDDLYYRDDTYLYKTTDGGMNWEEVGLIDEYHKYELYAVDKNTIWCSRPGLRVSRNGGHDWTSYEVDIGVIFTASPIASTIGWIGTNDLTEQRSKILFTGDAGKNWIEDLVLGTLSSTEVIAMTNIEGEYLWAVGSKGTIHHRRGIPTDIECEDVLIEQFELMQNYPNPFNPSTTIKYTIPNKDKRQKIKDKRISRTGREVKLVIYDMLGCEITTLVNQEQMPGSYEVEFNSSAEGLDLSSGVYFYRLQAGDFVSIKKMLMMK